MRRALAYFAMAAAWAAIVVGVISIKRAFAAPVRYLSPGYDNACTIQGSVTVTGGSGGLPTVVSGGVTVIIASNTGTSATITVSAPSAGLSTNVVNGVTVIIASNTGTSATLTVSAPAAGLNSNVVNGVTVIIASNTGTSATLTVSAPAAGLNTNVVNGVTVIIASNTGTSATLTVSAPAAGLNSNVVNGVTVIIASNTGTSATLIIGNPIAQGDVNNASKAANMGVTSYVGSFTGNSLTVIPLFRLNNTAAGAYEMVGATPVTDSGSTARGNGLFAVIGADSNNAGKASLVSTTFYNNSSSGASGKAGSALAVASIGACGLPTATPLAVTVANGGTIVLPSGTVAFEVRMKGGTALASGLIGTATDFVSVATDAMVSASNGSGVAVTHESSNVTAVAGAVFEGPWKVKDLNIGATGGTLYMVPGGGTVVVEVIYQTVR